VLEIVQLIKAIILLTYVTYLQSVDIGVLNGQPRNSSGKQCISVIVGQRELKWRVRDILARPGLRRETWLFSQPPAADPAVTPTSPPRPWTFKTAASVGCRMTFG